VFKFECKGKKDIYVILKKIRSLSVKRVRRGGKNQNIRRLFCKSQELAFKSQILVKLRKGCKCSVVFK
jgi:hypothetical protein